MWKAFSLPGGVGERRGGINKLIWNKPSYKFSFKYLLKLIQKERNYNVS